MAKRLGKSLETHNPVGAKMILIPPGEFLMGSTDEQSEAAWQMAAESNANEGHIHLIRDTERPPRKVAITKRPNPFGLFDMYGNLSEWCSDYFDEGWYGKSPTHDPTGPTAGSARAVRGGHWVMRPFGCRSASRNSGKPMIRNDNLGVRYVRVLDCPPVAWADRAQGRRSKCRIGTGEPPVRHVAEACDHHSGFDGGGAACCSTIPTTRNSAA